MKILVINSGSSSIKYSLFDMEQPAALATGLVEKIGEASSRIKHTIPAQAGTASKPATEVVRELVVADHRQWLSLMAGLLMYE